MNEKRIREAFLNVDFKNSDEVQEAAEKLKGIEPREILDWIANQLETRWHYSEVLNGAGVQNIESIFGVEFDLRTLINVYFAASDHCHFAGKNRNKRIEEFNELTGRQITVDDVTRNIDIDFLIDSHVYGPGFDEFVEFIEDNGGDPRLLVQKIAPVVDKLPHVDIEDIVYYMEPYIKDGDIDMNKIFSKINWKVLDDCFERSEFVEFFLKHAPALAEKIPA